MKQMYKNLIIGVSAAIAVLAILIVVPKLAEAARTASTDFTVNSSVETDVVYTLSETEIGVEMLQPTIASVATTSSGTLLQQKTATSDATTTYRFMVAASDGQGTTTLSTQKTIITTNASSTGRLITWTAIQGAEEYLVYYATSTSFSYNQYFATTSAHYKFATTSGHSNATRPTETSAFVNKLSYGGDSWFLGGSLGIGTTSPSALLSVGASNQFTVDADGNLVANTISAGTTTVSKLIVSDIADGALNMNNNVITNIGAATTDFLTDGGLTISAATSTFATTVTEQLEANAVTHLHDTLNVDGAVTLESTLTITATTSITGDFLVDIDSLFVDVADDSVGFSTTTPIYTVDVNGTLRASNIEDTAIGATSPSTGAFTTLGVSGTSTLSADVYVDSGTFYVDSNDDRVGIGTTTPLHLLTVAGNTDITGVLMVKGDTTLESDLNVTATSTLDGDLIVDSGTLYVDVNDNRVGIGTTTPELELDVVGDIRGVIGYFTTTSIGNTLTIGTDTIIGSGVTDIRGGASSTFEIAGGLTLQSSGNLIASSSDDMVLVAGGSEALRVLETGNVGIGTTTPYHPFQVDGLIQSDGFYGDMAHLYIAATTTQSIAVANVAQEITFSEVMDEHGDWGVTDQVSSSTIEIPNTGTYSMVYCFQPELGAGANQAFEYALFKNGIQEEWSGGQRIIASTLDIGSTCRPYHTAFNAGDKLMLKMSGTATDIQITATSSAFTTMPTASWSISQNEGE